MIAFGAYLVASVVATAAPAPARAEPLASTYDQAACDPSDSGECTADPQLADEEPPPAPAVLDCNDPRLDAYIAGMIGSCDMPAPTPPGVAAPTVHPSAPTGPHRLCDGLCAHEAYPVHPAPRATDDSPPLASSARPFLAPPPASALHFDFARPPRTIFASRLERPPRA